MQTKKNLPQGRDTRKGHKQKMETKKNLFFVKHFLKQGFLTCPYGTGKFSNKNVVFVSFPLENLWKTLCRGRDTQYLTDTPALCRGPAFKNGI